MYMYSQRLEITEELSPKSFPSPSFSEIKVRKRAKIRNRYNEEPHLTQDTNGKVTTSQLAITNESQEVSSVPAPEKPSFWVIFPLRGK